MNIQVGVLALLLASALVQSGGSALAQVPASPGQLADERALREIDRRLLDAVIKGDRDFFEGLLADEAIITDRDGKVVAKAEALKNFQPLPDLMFSLARVEVRVLVHGDAAVVSGRSVGTVQAGSQAIKVDERSTDMYARMGGRWRLIAGHTSAIPAEQAAAKIDAQIYDLYVGEYQLTPLVMLVVSNEGGKLMTQPMSGGKPAGPKSELVPSSEATFFTRGQVGETVFVRDEKGRVTHLLIRGGGQEIKLMKVK